MSIKAQPFEVIALNILMTKRLKNTAIVAS
jgi:hypothetical protein